MEVSELMFGNWVLYDGKSYQYYAPYLDIEDEISNVVLIIDKNKNKYLCGIKYIAPIPLTGEILEANGFTRSKVFVEWKYEDDNIYMLWKPFPWIKIEMEDHTVMFPCEYVHELQNALLLCGIDKEIIL